MLVLSLVDCPAALRGDLTKWLLEINAGVFVGRVSARVRDNIWKRIEKYAKAGRPTMVYRAANEQGFDFRALRSDWEPIDFDGIKLLLRPSPSRIKHLEASRKPGYSKAARYRMSGRRASAGHERGTDAKNENGYVVFDIETTGLLPKKSEILEIAAIKIEHGEIQDTFATLIKTSTPISSKIETLTGITNAMVAEHGKDLPDALARFLEFAGDAPLVAHNARFDMSFLNAACQKLALNMPENEITDTLSLARSTVSGVKQYTLKALSEYFDLGAERCHRALDDCMLTWRLYEKVMDLRAGQK
jgi:CRISPR-associated protein Cas2